MPLGRGLIGGALTGLGPEAVVGLPLVFLAWPPLGPEVVLFPFSLRGTWLGKTDGGSSSRLHPTL